MCELMGLSFTRPLSADFSIHAFGQRAEHNADGWGLAWYPDHSATVVKEALDWRRSSYSQFLETYEQLQSATYIAHVRQKSTGGMPTHADTHPFDRELFGRHYCFAHNGTISHLNELELDRFRPIGGTDSEHIFCHLLDRLAKRNEHLETDEGWQWLHQLFSQINGSGTFNCLLTDGIRLCCYHDVHAWKGLTYRELGFMAGGPRRFEDATVGVTLASDPQNRGVVVATCPLSTNGWQRFQPGQLIVLERGRQVYSSLRSSSAA